jgi:GNAT superfamily N-acetyltransferase
MKKKADGKEMEYRSLPQLAGVALEDFARIYEESLPAGEREPTDQVVAAIARGDMVCFAAMDGEHLRGLSVLRMLRGPAEGIHFLVYLAVDKDYRSGGAGAKLLAACIEQLRPKHGVVLEVEDSRDTHATNIDQRKARVAFYQRNGGAIVQGAPNYRVPDSAHVDQTLTMQLMWIPSGGMAVLTGDLLSACVVALLTQGYGLQANEPLVRANLSALTAGAKL